MARLVSPRISRSPQATAPPGGGGGARLIQPLDLAPFYPPAQSSTFHADLQKDLDDLDAAASDPLALALPIELPDVIAIAKTMDDPSALVDQGLAFEAADSSSTFLDDAIAAAPSLDTQIATNETNIGKIAPQGSKIGLVLPPITGVNVPGASPPTPPPSPQLPPVGSGLLTPPLAGAHAVIININRPGDPAHFRVGDPWQINITAAAGSKIYAIASHNGVSLGQAAFGVVPAGGVLPLHGTFTADQLGSWVENWYAGDKFVGQVAFQVG